MKRHPTILSTQPDSQSKKCRSQTAPATHQDQGDEDLRTRSPAPGTTWRPRKSSSSAGRVHKNEMTQSLGCPFGRHHLLAHGRRADRSLDDWRRGRSTHVLWFFQHPSWLLPRRTYLSKGLFRVEGYLVLHDVIRRSRQLVSQRSDGDDPICFCFLPLHKLPRRLVMTHCKVGSF